jgi:hypothetical protein
MAAPNPSKPPFPNSSRLITQQVQTQRTEVTRLSDGLVPLAEQLNTILNGLDKTQQGVRTKFNEFLSEIEKQISLNEHLIKDVGAMAKTGKAAQDALKAAEESKNKVESLNKQLQESSEAMKQQVGEFKSAAEKAEQSKTQALADQKRLQIENSELSALHNYHIQTIATSIQTLTKLKEEIEKMERVTTSLKSTTGVIHGYVNWYVKYPYLIKIRELVIKNELNTHPSVVSEPQLGIAQINELTTLFTQNPITPSINNTVAEIQTIMDSLGDTTPNVKQRWTEIVQKLNDTMTFWKSASFNDYTHGFFFIALWVHERTKIPYSEDLKKILDKILETAPESPPPPPQP